MLAQRAFLDGNRVLVEDVNHSTHEERFYCIDKVGDGIVTGDSHIGAMLYAYMEPVIGERESKYMKRKRTYTDEPMGEPRVIEDFLPAPDRLLLKDENIKVTISLSKSSVEFFKEVAKKQNTSYQKMIRKVIDLYASHYKESA